MHCSKCKTVIEKGVMIAESYGEYMQEGNGKLYCKDCFKKEFDIK